MGDIYSSHNKSFLADAEDEQDFDMKLESLEHVREDLAMVFYDWFNKMRSDTFKECLMPSARKELGISCRFTSNGLELKHKLRKKKLADDKICKEVGKVTAPLKEWAKESFFPKQQKPYKLLVNIIWQLHMRSSMLIHYNGLSGHLAITSNILQHSVNFVQGLMNNMKIQKFWA